MKHTKKQIIRRSLDLIIIVLGLTFLTYLLMYLAPGDPAQHKLTAQGVPVSEEVLQQTRHSMGLDRPFIVRYGEWLGHAARGDLGTSYKDGLPVSDKLFQALGYTAVLTIISLLFSLLVSIPLSILTAVQKGRPVDRIVGFFSFVGNSLPNFLISVLLMYFLCIKLQLLPVIARGDFTGLILPCLALSIPVIGRFLRQFRAEILEQLDQDYVVGARTRGVSERTILYRNVLYNAAIPILTIVGLAFGSMMGGSVVIETIFSWPGLGDLVMDAISDRDYPVIQGFVLLTSIIYVLVNLVIDIIYHHLDPRILEQKGGTR